MRCRREYEKIGELFSINPQGEGRKSFSTDRLQTACHPRVGWCEGGDLCFLKPSRKRSPFYVGSMCLLYAFYVGSMCLVYDSTLSLMFWPRSARPPFRTRLRRARNTLAGIGMLRQKNILQKRTIVRILYNEKTIAIFAPI